MKVAHTAMRSIQRERTDYGNTTYFKLRGMEAAVQERKAESIDWLLKAELAYLDCQMPLHANVMRWCRGVQLGVQGKELMIGAEEWMSDHGILKPHHYVRVHAQGFDSP